MFTKYRAFHLWLLHSIFPFFFHKKIGPNGTISGRHLDEFLSNPTLLETNQIRANCYINSLEIDGPLYITNTINDIFLDDILSDIVYKHEPSPQINSLKRFASIQAPNIQLTSNVVNGIPFSSFVTKDTEQTFHVNKLNADVRFDRLNLDGLFNFINITELDSNAIKLFGDQYTNAELIFEDGDYLNIDAAQLQVLETINNINVSYKICSSFNLSTLTYENFIFMKREKIV